jgi:hypothetical protein
MLNIPRANAETVDRAVQQWAASGQGFVHSAGDGVFLLYVDASYVVEFMIDVADDTMHVDRLRPASPS